MAFLLGVAACDGLPRACAPDPLDKSGVDALYAEPAQRPQGPLHVYHLGHSLVGRDMPAMLRQLADAGLGQAGHAYASQLGWGASLKDHWTGEINGFDVENDHPRFRDATEALASGNYDAVVLTEMVEIRDAIKWHDSWDYLGRWAKRAIEARPDVVIYLYETWHTLDDPEGWLERLDRDLGRYWETEIVDRALSELGGDRPIYLIPAGQVLARFVRLVEERGGVGPIRGREDLFLRDAEGKLDTIHVNDLGMYLVALTHYAVLYHRDPAGLPHSLLRADGTPAADVGEEAGRLMQQVVWEVVTSLGRTGVRRQAD